MDGVVNQKIVIEMFKVCKVLNMPSICGSKQSISGCDQELQNLCIFSGDALEMLRWAMTS